MNKGQALHTGVHGEGKQIAARLRRLNWKLLEESLWEFGYAITPPLLTRRECEKLSGLYPRDEIFRSTVDMKRHRFGLGQYRYFARPLPPLVEGLRVSAYPHLFPIANRWGRALGRSFEYPPSLDGFLELCRENGQTRPTPLLLRYEAGGYNCLHQDLYGDIAFPLQLVCFLGRVGVDYEGGDFLLVEQRPRSQSRGESIRAGQGQCVIFTNAERPVLGSRGYYRVRVKHGAGTVRSGTRLTLGIIFHDAR